MDFSYAQYSAEKAAELLAIDSPTGFTDAAAVWVKEEFEKLGFPVTTTVKGGLLVDFGGKNETDAIMIQAHIDTIGAMVAEVKSNGRLRVTRLGGLRAENTEAENVKIYTRDGKVYEGTLQLCNPSAHVNLNYSDIKRSFDTTEVVIDEDVRNEEETRALGIETGDFVCFDPKTRFTESGYIKSRFLDDKLAVGIVLGLGKYLKDNNITLDKRVYIHITVFEEVGHGGSASVPAGVTEVLSIDMGCVGDGLKGTERKVSICAKDAKGPYNYHMTGKLIDAAKAEGADYAVDVYPNYGSDVDTTLIAGNDIRHGLIGPGVFASHGYERSHMDGVMNTLKVLKGYLKI